MSEAVPPPVVQEVVQAAIVVGAAPAVESVVEGVDEAVTVTVAVCVTGTPLIVAETVFASAVVELSVPVAMPLAFVVPTG